jgi:hypothetical protein
MSSALEVREPTTGTEMRAAIHALKSARITIERADINLITGHIWVKVSWLTSDNTGRLVTAMRGSWSGKVVVKSEITSRKDGMYKCWWGIDDQLSDVRFDDAREALISTFQRVADNHPALTNEARDALGLIVGSLALSQLGTP